MSRWELTKKFTFEASHTLPNHKGACRHMHGHSWGLEIVIAADRLDLSGPGAGMVLDFGHIKEAVKPLIDEYLDHKHLNESTGLANPTSEALAEWIYRQLQTSLPEMVAVVIEETATSRCRYEP